MIYCIPIIGWLLGLVFSILLAIPAYFLWNHVAPIYFYWLPPIYLAIPFWNMVFLIMTISILKAVLLPQMSVNNTANANKR